MYYYYVPQVYPYVNYYPVYDTSRQYELYRQQQVPQLLQIPSQQPTQDQNHIQMYIMVIITNHKAASI